MPFQLPFVTRWQRRRPWAPLSLALLFVVLAPGAAFAQDAHEFLALWQNQVMSFRMAALSIAQGLFASFAVLEVIVAVYSMSVNEQLGPDSIFRRLAMKFLVMAAVFLLLLKPDFALDPILGGIEQIGAQIGGHPVYEPGSILAAGTALSFRFMELFEMDIDLSFWDAISSPIDNTANLIMAVPQQMVTGMILLASMFVFMVSFLVLAGQLIVARIKLYLALSVGLFFAGFASFRATAGIPEAWVRYAVQVGVQLFLIQVMMGFADSLFAHWDTMLGATFQRIELEGGMTITWVDPGKLFQLLGGCALFTFLAWKIPAEVAGRVTGDLRLGLSEAIRGR